MAKIDISDETFAFVPITTQTILGTHVGGRANFMALGWLTRCNHKPPMIAISVNKGHQSADGVLQNGEFSINVPSTDMVAITDYTGLVSAKKVDKSELFALFYGGLKAAPLIKGCPVNVECRVVEMVELPTNYLFVGEVVGVHAEESVLTDGIPDVEKVKPFVLSMPDNRFWVLGDCVGRAWQEGKGFKK
ncbi:MAG: flavin reductase family protein [Deltaproteobacteria bacterium]|uniref:Flavin reductase family protein n=1 Tax=Candidatus Zymogenus saltonus TaxID=2844893 RepID=A0A9D8KDX8_9DELT|nr:flavin reductase family protein [Candidatus Zymogenus saltonus]